MESTKIIADRLVSLLRGAKFVEAYQELFDEQAESIDPLNKSEPRLKGLETLIQWEIAFLSKVQVKDIEISDPIVAGELFSVSLKMIFNIAEEVERTVEELCLYKIENGKIISQQFFVAGKS